MASSTTLSLKELRTSRTLKTEISQLEAEKQQLLDQLERQKMVEKKLQQDIVEQKKDFEHLEKQFEHFAGIEAEFEELQHEIQMERLENMVENDKRDAQFKIQLQKSRDETKAIQSELKEFKKLDPMRLKRQVTDLKKKSATQASENKAINNALIEARKELRETTVEKDKLDKELQAARNGSDFFWESVDGQWKLFESRLTLKDEEETTRVSCMNTGSGFIVLSKELDTEAKHDKAIWHGDIEIPEDVSIEAGKRLKKIAAEAEED